jgi:phage host-nuclease inhibitor protein Gam
MEIKMALTEETVQDKIEVVGDYKHVQVRTATIIKKDGTEISRSFHRHVVAPNADISGESTEVQAICNAVHTDAIKTAYAKYLESQGV